MAKKHRPEQLVMFYLPEVEIDGLGLREALEKVMEAYVAACEKSGETPLAFTFDVPADDASRLRMKLSSKSFSNAVRMLAAAAGMNVKRSGLSYMFERMPGDGMAKEGRIEMTDDFAYRLAELLGIELKRDPSAPQMTAMDLLRSIGSFEELLARLGMDLDPGTKIVAGEGEMLIQAARAEDLAKLQALAGLIAGEEKAQAKYTVKVLEIPAGFESNRLLSETHTDLEVQLLMRELAQQAGTNLMTMPSVQSVSGGQGIIEMAKEVYYPKGDGFESRMVGQEVDVKGGALGFGQEMNVEFQNTTVDGSQPVTESSFRTSARVSAEGYADDGVTRSGIQEREDGTKVLILVTTDRVDATGRVVRGR